MGHLKIKKESVNYTTMANKRLENAKRLETISKMTDVSLLGGRISEDEHKLVKSKLKELELDNAFKAMADYCN